MERNVEPEELSSDEAFAALLSKAPPRAAPPADDERIVRAAVRSEWQAVTGERLRRRRVASLALAASLLLAVVGVFNLTSEKPVDISGMQMAAVDKQFGAVSINSRDRLAGQLAAINGGDVVETAADAGLALAWHDGGSLRIDENTSVVFEAQNRIFLRHGRVYFDSVNSHLQAQGARARASNFEIRTVHGLVRHLGTQYMTSVAGDSLVIAVREGVVAVDGEVTARASAGQQFAISAGGELTIGETNGVDEWEWIEKSTPAINLDGRLIAEALEWVSRESGRSIRYASDNAEALARTERLRGDYNMSPSRALNLFLLTTDLSASIEGEEIIISEN
ncbi:MAG: FecR family protein [Woeseiaceae bacterium]|nr:FecR family protein [Woeseiaceae bacterium]